jgi:hypothetical protein
MPAFFRLAPLAMKKAHKGVASGFRKALNKGLDHLL